MKPDRRVRSRRFRVAGEIKIKPGHDPKTNAVRKGCLKKRKYRQRKWAASAASHASKKAGRPITLYHCHACGNYHLRRLPLCGNCKGVLHEQPRQDVNVLCAHCGAICILNAKGSTTKVFDFAVRDRIQGIIIEPPRPLH